MLLLDRRPLPALLYCTSVCVEANISWNETIGLKHIVLFHDMFCDIFIFNGIIITV